MDTQQIIPNAQQLMPNAQQIMPNAQQLMPTTPYSGPAVAYQQQPIPASPPRSLRKKRGAFSSPELTEAPRTPPHAKPTSSANGQHTPCAGLKILSSLASPHLKQFRKEQEARRRVQSLLFGVY